jgi:hypothetical protein
MKTKKLLSATLLLLGILVFQNCKKSNVEPVSVNSNEVLASLRNTPQVVFQTTINTEAKVLEKIKTSQISNKNSRMLNCFINPGSAFFTAKLIHTGDCSQTDYQAEIKIVVWNEYQTGGLRGNPGPIDPVLSNVIMKINGQTVNVTAVYGWNDTPSWLVTGTFDYTSLGISTQTTSLNAEVSGTFTCASGASGNFNNSHTISLDACNSDGVIYPQPMSGQVMIFFPWDIVPCNPGWLNPPGLCYEIWYRPVNSTGPMTVVKGCGFGPKFITDSPGSYAYYSFYSCSGQLGWPYSGTFAIL